MYIIQTAAACMPASCKGRYKRIAILEVEDWVAAKGYASMISERAKGVRRVVATWEKLNVGRTSKCAYRRALAEAEAMLAELRRGPRTEAPAVAVVML